MPGEGALAKDFGAIRSPTSIMEMAFLRQNPKVAGIAADDNNVVLNPHSNLTAEQYRAVARNERVRLLMRLGLIPAPAFPTTPEQQKMFFSYSSNPSDVLETIVARAFSADPSSGQLTSAQREYVEKIVSPAMKGRGW